MDNTDNIDCETHQPPKHSIISELYQYRSTYFSIVRNQLFGRYKNTLLGFGWHFIGPLIMLFVFYVAFSSTGGSSLQNRWLYLASGLFTFSFLTSAITGGCTCIIGNAAMVKKIYFPREILILAQITTNFIVSIIGYIFVFIGAIAVGHPLTIYSFLFLIPLFLFNIIFGTGIMFLTSTLTVYVRDLQYALSSISMIFFFLTPMYFIADQATGLRGTLIWYNPLTYFVEFAHQAIYWGIVPNARYFTMCILLSIITFVIGYWIFKKLKRGLTERL